MTRYTRLLSVAAVVAVAALGPAVHAQDVVTGGGPLTSRSAPGWTFIPSAGFTEMYDNNVTLLGLDTFDNLNNDYVSTVHPGVAVDFTGKHTQFGAEYTGSYVDYRTFDALNRWDQGASVDFKRQESNRFRWFANASRAALPSTDLVDFGGIPFRRVGTDTTLVRTGGDYRFSARQSISQSYEFQAVAFDRPPELPDLLAGGHVHDSVTGYRWRTSERMAIGADYTFRHSIITERTEQFDVHDTMGVVDYTLSQSWALSAGAGVAHLMSTAFSDSTTGPSWRISVDHVQDHSTLRLSYLRTFLPSFGLGGTSDSQQLEGSFRLQLSRRFYTEHTASFFHDQPLVNVEELLPLRSFHETSILGWAPQPWVRLEMFYSRTQQTTLRVGGQIGRDRFGFQIVTSKPMRIQ